MNNLKICKILLGLDFLLFLLKLKKLHRNSTTITPTNSLKTYTFSLPNQVKATNKWIEHLTAAMKKILSGTKQRTGHSEYPIKKLTWKRIKKLKIILDSFLRKSYYLWKKLCLKRTKFRVLNYLRRNYKQSKKIWWKSLNWSRTNQWQGPKFQIIMNFLNQLTKASDVINSTKFKIIKGLKNMSQID